MVAAGSALWLGILTSVSPCPLATNIAAISYVGRRIASPRMVLASGVLYTAGRALTYLVLGVLLVESALSAPAVSHFLQKHMNRLLGPLLVLTGMALLELIALPTPRVAVSEERAHRWLQRTGVAGAVGLGMLFALAFCPVSAALFFGGLLPLAVRAQSSVLLPSLYGVGTGLPVLAFALVLTFAAGSVGRAFQRVQDIERWTRRATGVIFLGVGIYFTVVHLFMPLLRG